MEGSIPVEGALHPQSGKWLVVLVLFLAPFLAYANSIGNGFVHDDQAQVVNNPSIRGLRNAGDFFLSDVWSFYKAKRDIRVRYWRPLFLLSYALDYRMFGLSAWGYHLVNLMLHLGCVFLVRRVIAVVTGDGQLAFFAALIFGLHPVNSEAVNWIGSRHVLLSALFILISFLLFDRARSTHPRPTLLVPGVISYGLALLSWETAIMFPLILTADSLLNSQPTGRGTLFRNTLVPLFIFVAVAMAYLLLRREAVGEVKIFASGYSARELALTLPVILARYAGLLLWPVRLYASYPLTIFRDPSEPIVIIGIVTTAAVVALSIVLLLRRPHQAAWLAWVLLPLAPAFNLGAFGENMMAERYLYLPTVGFSALAAAVILRGCQVLRVPRCVTIALCGALCLVFSIRVVVRNPVWKDDITYYTRTLEQEPRSAILQNNLGVIYERAGDYQSAVERYRLAIQYKPNYEDPYYNLGVVAERMGNLEEAKQYFERARELNPTWTGPYFALGELARKQGDLEGARREWLKVITLRPDDSRAHNALGNVALLRGDVRKAISHYRTALKGDRENAEVYYNLAMALDRLGRPAEARPYYQKFLNMAPPEYSRQIAAARSRLSEIKGSDPLRRR